MIIFPHTLSLITTHHCTASCDNCCFDCSPKITKRLSLETMKRLILDTNNIPSISSVVFTGGECFTLKEDLNELVLLASSLGHNTRCITNGYWAVSICAATRRLESLVKNGLKEINFSTGTFHQKYVKQSNIINGVLASVDLGLRVVVNIEYCNESELFASEFLKDPRIKDLSDKRQIHSYVCNRKTIFSKEDKSHCHFICKKCGKIEHIKVNSLDFIKNKINGSICHFQIDVTGLCDDCSKKND